MCFQRQWSGSADPRSVSPLSAAATRATLRTAIAFLGVYVAPFFAAHWLAKLDSQQAAPSTANGQMRHESITIVKLAKARAASRAADVVPKKTAFAMRNRLMASQCSLTRERLVAITASKNGLGNTVGVLRRRFSHQLARLLIHCDLSLDSSIKSHL